MPLLVSSRKFYGFGIWLSVRIFGIAAHGNHTGADTTGIRCGIISTYPSVIYRVEKASETIEVDNPINLPDPRRSKILEPTIKATIHVPNDCIGDILNLVMDKRGICDHTETLDDTRLMIVANLPLNEILVDFNDRLKSITRGYGSMDYNWTNTENRNWSVWIFW